MVRESHIEQHLVRRVKEAGGEVRKLSWVNRRGAPDRLVLLPWRIVFVELKRPKGRAEDHQQREHKTLRDYGLDVQVLDTFELVDALVARN